MVLFLFLIVFNTIIRNLSEWSGGHSTPAGNRGKAETPQAKTRRLSFLPVESEWV